MMQDFENFIELVKKKSKIDLSQYKEAQMKRRLETFKDKKGHDTFLALFRAMETDNELYEEFLDRITINVSEFYRNKPRWDYLDEVLLPKLLKNKKNIKVWSAACSTGEEPYTMAMILSKYVPLSKISIVATDIDKNVLSRAREGLYHERSISEVPSEMREKHFIKNGTAYQISDELKGAVSFQHHNLLEDEFDSGFDLIICRNVMIYFTEPTKEVLYHRFNKALNEDGIFFVGSTEQIFTPKNFNFDVEHTFFYKRLN